MLTDEELLSKAKTLTETKLGWGNSHDWTNQDFIALSNKIQEETGASISHVTLKRLWGKVKYDALPQTNTLNTLVQFLGYESWRDFLVKNKAEPQPAGSAATSTPPGNKRPGVLRPTGSVIILLVLAAGAVMFLPFRKKNIDPKDYSFSIKSTTEASIPNSVVFNYDARKAPFDSVIIQQSWDTRLRTKVSRREHQHTLIYYFPGYFQPRLVVGEQVVKEQGLLIPSNGWITAFVRTPDLPIYFRKEDVMADGKMSLPLSKIKEQNVSLSPDAPMLSYCNVQDLGEIYTDNFVFETSLRNDYREGSSVCQMTDIYLLCEGTAIHIPLCAKGCESALSLFFTAFQVSGKQRDLSAFGVDFNSFIKIRVVSEKGRASIFVNEKPALVVDDSITKSRIIGIDFAFQGTGSVDYVKLFNEKLSFIDEF